MSWSVSFIGTPSGVIEELDKFGDTLSGQSKDEFMDAKPHLQGLVNQVVGSNVKLIASGHATITDGVKTYSNCSVVLETFYGKWCK